MRHFLAAQADFVGFGVGALILFAGLALILPRFRRGARLPPLAWVTLAVVLLAGWWPVQQAGVGERQQVETLVSALAPTYAHELARAGHSQLQLNTPPDDPVYQRILGLLDDWTRANPIAADIYTMRRLENGQPVFVADADTDYDGDGKISDRERGALPGEPFSAEDAGLEEAFAGKANFNPEIVTDRWGTWVGAWAPIFGPGGKVEAVVGVDYNGKEWQRAIRAARRERLVILGLILGIIAASFVAIGVLQGIAAERKIAQEKHAEAEQRLRLTLQQMPLAFVEIDPGGVMIGWNPAARAMFGYSQDEVIGKLRYESLVAPEARESVKQIFSMLLRQPLAQTNINENVTRDGRRIHCEWFNGQVVGGDGQVISVIALAQDVGERQSIEEQVRQSQRLAAVGQLAAGIAHDFNNLLTVINGYADLLQTRADMPASSQGDLKRIAQAGDRAANLTRQLLTFGRKQPMFPRSIALKSAVEPLTRLLQRTLGDGIELELDLDDELPPVSADNALFEQALTNLALNAREAGAGCVKIGVRLVEVSLAEARTNPERRAGRFIKLSFADDGKGLPPEIRPRVFEPFFTTKDVGEGPGLGLSAVHGIMKQHAGWVELRATPGAGAVFDLYFPPAQPATSAPLSGQRQAPVRSGKVVVLLVEDDPTVRQVARLSLERVGFGVLEAEDGPAAEELWSRHKHEINVLLTDLVMPNGVGGRELADRILVEQPGLPVVFASGYNVQAAIPGFTESAHTTLLQKPFLPEQLIAAVDRVTGRAGTASAA